MIHTCAKLSFLVFALLSTHVFAQDVAEVAHRIARQDCSADAWKDHLKEVRARYATWQNDNPSGSFKRFLDDRLLIHAMGVPSGKIENLKGFMYWLALYREYREPPPWYIRLLAKKHGKDFAGMLDDFSWEKFSAMITQRQADAGEDSGNVKKSLKALDKEGRKHGYAAVANAPAAPAPEARAVVAAAPPANVTTAPARPAATASQTIPLPRTPYLSAGPAYEPTVPLHVPISSQPDSGR